jgi:hypothetical protein
MRWRLALAAIMGLGLPVPAQAFDWDALGAEFCARSTAGDYGGVRPLLSKSLVAEIERAYLASGEAIPPTLFQSYVNRIPRCVARTRNAAMIELLRSGPNGAAPSWTEYLVVTPEADGTTRIDDVLFATRRSDTLRARLKAMAQ